MRNLFLIIFLMFLLPFVYSNDVTKKVGVVITQEKNYLSKENQKKLTQQLSDIFEDNEVVICDRLDKDKNKYHILIEINSVKNIYQNPIIRIEKKIPIYSYFFDNQEISKEEYDKISNYKREYNFAYLNWTPDNEEKTETSFYQYIKINSPNSFAVQYYEQYRGGVLREYPIGQILKKVKNSSINSTAKIFVWSELERKIPKKKSINIKYKTSDQVSWVDLTGDEKKMKELAPSLFYLHYQNYPFKEEQFCKTQNELMKISENELIANIIEKIKK